MAPGGSSGSEDSFTVSPFASHPQGRGKVKLEVEHCPVPAPFGDPARGGATSASWTEIVPPASEVELSETVSGLTSGTRYRWRARVLHAATKVEEPGITPPPAPAHSRRRRL